MSKLMTLREAIAQHVKPGDTVALEGFTHLIPFAAGHEIIRQGITDLTLVRMTPDVVYDMLIGAGCAKKLVFSWGGNPGVGSLHRFRDAVEKQWPVPLEVEEHSHAGMVTRFQAAASGLPFGTLRGYSGTDLAKVTPNIKFVQCPFTGESLAAVPAIELDVTVIHAQQADKDGNIGTWGISGVQKEAVLAAKHVIVTVEEIVEEFDPRVRQVLPAWTVDAIAVVPRGAHPSYAMNYYVRDNAAYLAWDPIARDRDTFQTWIREHILETQDFAEYLAKIGLDNPVLDGPGSAGLAEQTDLALVDFDAPATADEIMTVVASRELPDETVCFVGIGLPSVAANLARRTHAPQAVLVYESGTIGAKPTVPPLSIGDGELAETADALVGSPEIFAYWLQAGRIDVGFLGAAQLDRFGNINTTVVGNYDHPKVRLPGAGGAPEIATSAGQTFVMLRQSPKAFVERLDFITSVGHLEGGDARAQLGLPGAGPTVVITDIGVMRPDPQTHELVLTQLHPGRTVEEAIAATGWALKVSPNVTTTELPTTEELRQLRMLTRPKAKAHA